MDFGDHSVGTRNVVLELGNNDVCIYREFGLGTPS